MLAKWKLTWSDHSSEIRSRIFSFGMLSACDRLVAWTACTRQAGWWHLCDHTQRKIGYVHVYEFTYQRETDTAALCLMSSPSSPFCGAPAPTSFTNLHNFIVRMTLNDFLFSFHHLPPLCGACGASLPRDALAVSRVALFLPITLSKVLRQIPFLAAKFTGTGSEGAGLRPRL